MQSTREEGVETAQLPQTRKGGFRHSKSCIPIPMPAPTPFILQRSRMGRRARRDHSGGPSEGGVLTGALTMDYLEAYCVCRA